MGVKVTLKDEGYKKAYAEALRLAKTAKKLKITVGYFPDQVSQDGVPLTLIAAVHEYGTAAVPQRAFMSRAFRLGQRKYMALMRKGMRGYGRDFNKVAEVALEIALHAAEDIQRSILTSKRWAKPLADATIWKKGFDHPLIDKGDLLMEVKYKIEGVNE
jgi:hypothetical protein